jgi:hypothetical protein
MLAFLFGVIVGAAGFWAYKFWKGEDDTSWDQSFSTSPTTASTYGSSSSEAVGTGTTAGESGKTPTVSPE